MFTYSIKTSISNKLKPDNNDECLQVPHSIVEYYDDCDKYTCMYILKEYFDCILNSDGEPVRPNMDDIKKIRLYNNEEDMLPKILSYYCERYSCYEKLLDRLVKQENEKTSGDVTVHFDKLSRWCGCDKDNDNYSWVSESVTIHLEYTPDEEKVEEPVSEEKPNEQQQENV